MVRKKKKIGKVIKAGDANVWPHEDATAVALTLAGFTVEFIRKSERERENSADCYIDGEKWEMKAPRSGRLTCVEDNLKRAAKQSERIIFDSRRMKRVPDNAIMRELSTQLQKSKTIKYIRFVNRHGETVDIE